MNNRVSLLYSILIIAHLLSACRGSEGKRNENNAPARFASLRQVANETYVVDKKESVMTWKCSMQFVPQNGHNGYVDISKGELIMEKNRLMGGTVEVDMNTITDELHGSDNSLIDHLKSPDFFDSKKFPIATFTITEVAPANGENVNVTGDLTIKGVTHAVTFPVTIEARNGIVNANGNVTIDRAKWDVRYGSGKFFANLADETISDEIEFNIKLVARKK